MSKLLCVYHKNCPDGFGAAWVVRLALGREHVEMHAAAHQTAPPDVKGRSVLIVDFCYPRESIARILEEAESVMIFDHHKTARDDLRSLTHPHLTTVFDMDKSGCGITWEQFFPGQVLPRLLAHIQDHDLWRFRISGTRVVMAGLFSWPYDFEVWDGLMSRVPDLARDGLPLLRAKEKELSELRATAGLPRLRIGGWLVPAFNVPHTCVGLANPAAEGEPFAACYWVTERQVSFSLRSSPQGLDVAEIARQYGGGGHQHAAGFRLSLEYAVEFFKASSVPVLFRLPAPAREMERADDVIGATVAA